MREKIKEFLKRLFKTEYKYYVMYAISEKSLVAKGTIIITINRKVGADILCEEAEKYILKTNKIEGNIKDINNTQIYIENYKCISSREPSDIICSTVLFCLFIFTMISIFSSLATWFVSFVILSLNQIIYILYKIKREQ